MGLEQLAVDDDTQAKHVLKYQADHLAKALWRLTNDRIHWQSASARTAQNGRTVERQVGRPDKPSFIVVTVQSNLYLGVESHYLRLWRSDYAKFYTLLSVDEMIALQDYLLKPRYTAAFYLRRGERRMYRSGDTDEVLERLLLKLIAKCERGRLAQRTPIEQEMTT